MARDAHAADTALASPVAANSTVWVLLVALLLPSTTNLFPSASLARPRSAIRRSRV
jgi:hypothetical protein